MDNVKPREVEIGPGVLLLRTKQAQETFELLASSGNFWEYISSLLDEPRQQSVGMDQLVEMIKSLNDKLATAGTGSLPTLLNDSESANKKVEVVVQKLEEPVTLDTNIANLLAGFASSGGNNSN